VAGLELAIIHSRGDLVTALAAPAVGETELGALGPGGGPEHKAHDMAASQNAVKLSIGGQDVSIDEQERVMLRPPDPAISLDFLARMLGGKAKIDPGTGMWVLPRGGPGDPMMFTK